MTAEEALADAAEQFGRIAIACSLQKESAVILDLATRIGRDRFEIFTLDTGVLFDETVETIDAYERHFGVTIERVRGTGPHRLWESDPDACCRMRKVMPLRERLAGCDAWVTGVRREQSKTRSTVGELHWDATYGLWKVAPLAAWTEADVWNHIMDNGLPYHPLHDRGYSSIGCEPCTRPGTGREGRWVGRAKSECGIHIPALSANAPAGHAQAPLGRSAPASP